LFRHFFCIYSFCIDYELVSNDTKQCLTFFNNKFFLFFDFLLYNRNRTKGQRELITKLFTNKHNQTMKKTFDFGGIVLTVEVEEVPTNTTCCRETRRAVREEREPDGICVQVDKPLRSNYAYTTRGTIKFNEDMGKYRNLEKAAKACDWANRGPITETVPCESRTVRAPRATRTETRELKWCEGRVPVGAKVVDHTVCGEPIFQLP